MIGLTLLARIIFDAIQPLAVAVWLLYFSFGLVAAGFAPIVRLVEADLSISHAAMGSIMRPGNWPISPQLYPVAFYWIELDHEPPSPWARSVSYTHLTLPTTPYV